MFCETKYLCAMWLINTNYVRKVLGLVVYLTISKQAFILLFFFFLEQESKTLRVNDIHAIIHTLPEPNFEMLDLVIGHLNRSDCVPLFFLILVTPTIAPPLWNM